MTQNDPEWAKINQNDPEWAKMTQNEQTVSTAHSRKQPID